MIEEHTYYHEEGCCDDQNICARCEECGGHYINCVVLERNQE